MRQISVKRSQLATIGAILIVLSVFLTAWFLMRGEITVVGGWPDAETSELLICKAENIPYDIYKTDDYLNSNTQINAIFNDDKIISISLIRKTVYPNVQIAKVQSDSHEFDVNYSFGEAGLGAYALGASFTSNDNKSQMSLYANSKELNEITSKYFLLQSSPDDINGYMKNYTDLGFECEKKNN